MHTTPLANRRLPYHCSVLCGSLAGATVLLLFLYLLYVVGLLSAETAFIAAIGVFLLAALFESSLVFVIMRHMMKKLRNNGSDPG
jgi:hypothetical protein